jgi:6,7-dimethyl-8-ribityllumazine synthase
MSVQQSRLRLFAAFAPPFIFCCGAPMNRPEPFNPSALIPPPNAEPLRVAFVQACWHRDIVDRCRSGFDEEMKKLGFSSDQLEYFEVPGAFELPLQTRLLAKTGRYAAVLAAGLVVDGGIYRHDFVATAVIDGLMRNQLDTEVPILSAVLTPHHFHDHEEHQRYFSQHFAVKGIELARSCDSIIKANAQVRQIAKAA